MHHQIIKTFAKINIGLNIVAKRNDGFHNIETLFYPINDLYDELVFEDSNDFQFNSEYKFDNIILKTVQALEERTNRELCIKISLKKNIPIGAGLGGGSSNAAGTLVALNRICDLNLSTIELKNIALELGSDVPFFLQDKPAIGKSRGEYLTNVDLKIVQPILLVNPGIQVSTKEAFSNITPKSVRFNYDEIVKLPINQYSHHIVNDFESSIFQKYPEIENIKDILNSNGALFASMSGTGSTVYGIFEDIEAAENASEKFPDEYFTFISQ